MTLKLFTDGGSKGNPGPSAIGIVAYHASKELFRYREDIGVATNNEAEYRALIKGLELIKTYLTAEVARVDCYSDSRLIVNQVNGVFKIKEARMREFIIKIRILETEIGCPVYYHDIPREQNQVADALVNDK